MSAKDVLSLARQQGIMIATAESCTGGMVAAALTDIPGSSDAFDRGFITYSNAAKTQMLGVPATLIKTHGAVSEEVARAMAEGALAQSDATLAVSITGVAGPGGTPQKPEGMVCFGIGSPGNIQTETVQFGAIGRSNVRQKSVNHALARLKSTLL